MAKNSAYNASEEFVLDRWAQSRDLARVFKQSVKKMRRAFKKTGKEMTPFFAAKDLALVVDDEWAEFRAYKQAWCVQPDEPLVTISVGGLLPVGYSKVEEPSAYACLCLQHPDDGGMSLSLLKFERRLS